MCKFTYRLKFIYNPQTNTQYAFEIIHRNVQNGIFQIEVEDENTVLSLALIIQKCFLHHSRNITFLHFLCTMVPKCYLVILSIRMMGFTRKILVFNKYLLNMCYSTVGQELDVSESMLC